MDVQVLYPVLSDFIDGSEFNTPELYNYFCYRGKQLFFRRLRNRFQIVSGHWYPPNSIPKTSVFNGLHVLVDVSVSQANFDFCLHMFELNSKTMIELHRHVFSNPDGGES